MVMLYYTSSDAGVSAKYSCRIRKKKEADFWDMYVRVPSVVPVSTWFPACGATSEPLVSSSGQTPAPQQTASGSDARDAATHTHKKVSHYILKDICIF